MGEVLYRKYRSKSLDEVVGQDHITTTLKNALKTNQISHAYLFTGPKGVGKTSVARILAREVNNLPYDENTHLDIIEIDAASNRRIDEIRDLRDKVNIAPTSARYKVYIIDEVHMLTKEAFNALLKTLEEPPKHVIFILATTDFHKIPDTIVSRTQRFTFKPIAFNKLVSHLKKLADKESINVDEDALQLIARHGEGSFRDSISLLDTLKASGKPIDIDEVKSLLGVPSDDSIINLLSDIDSGNLSSLKHNLKQLIVSGYQPSEVAKLIIDTAHESAMTNNTSILSYEQLTDLLKVGSTHDPQKALEIILISAALGNSGVNNNLSSKIDETKIKKVNSPKLKKDSKNNTPKKTKPANNMSPDDPQLWQEVLKQLKGSRNTLYGIARMAKASNTKKKLILKFPFPFHQRRCNENNNKKSIELIVNAITGQKLEVECTLEAKKEQLSRISNKPDNANRYSINSVRDIFGGGEVL